MRCHSNILTRIFSDRTKLLAIAAKSEYERFGFLYGRFYCIGSLYEVPTTQEYSLSGALLLVKMAS